MAAGIIVVGSILAVIAGAMTYMITRNEMDKHFRDTRRPRRAALQDAVFTVVFFFALALLLSFVLPHMFRSR